MPRFLFTLLIFCTWCIVANASENLALHRSYIYSPKPNYLLCTDDSDSAQLTDGKSFGSKWTEKSTVGWRKPEPFVEVVIDLGQICTIEEVNVHTIGGGAATVEYPEFVAVLLSDKNSQFKFAGLASGRDFSDIRSTSSGITGIMIIENINSSGRFVKLVAKPNGSTLFMDEIQVFGKKFSSTQSLNPRTNLETINNNEQLLVRIDEYMQLQDNIAAIIETVQSKNSVLSGDEKEKMLSSIRTAAGKISYSTNSLPTAEQIQGKNELTGKIKAQFYNELYQKPFVCLQANPMEIVLEKDMPANEPVKEINIKMWQNEYESAAFNIINCSQSVMKMTAYLSPLLAPKGEKINSNETFTIRKSHYVIASGIGSIADALLLQNENSFNIMPGELIQIWLTVHNPQLAGGQYEAKVAVAAVRDNGENFSSEVIPIHLKIYETKIPAKMSLNTCLWDYYDAGVLEEMAEDLRSHYTNVCVVPAQDLPFLRFSSDPPGTIRKPDYTRLDETVRQHQYAETILLGLNFSISQKDYGRFGNVQWMSNDWIIVFTSWLKNLVTHLKNIGVDYDRFALYPFDESLADEYYDLARLIKSVDPKIRLYANSFGNGPTQFLRFRNLIDIWCLQDSLILKNPEWFEMIKRFGSQMWTYECLEPMKAQQPYTYYRLLLWRAFQRGLGGAGIWTYYYGQGFEPGGVPWYDTLRPQGFSGVVYGAKSSPVTGLFENIVPSRRWQAWREGVEDYQYLYELQQEINTIKITDSEIAEKAQEILDEQVNRVLENPDNCNLVYDAREILTETLLKLSNQNDPGGLEK